MATNINDVMQNKDPSRLYCTTFNSEQSRWNDVANYTCPQCDEVSKLSVLNPNEVYYVLFSQGNWNYVPFSNGVTMLKQGYNVSNKEIFDTQFLDKSDVYYATFDNGKWMLKSLLKEKQLTDDGKHLLSGFMEPTPVQPTPPQQAIKKGVLVSTEICENGSCNDIVDTMSSDLWKEPLQIGDPNISINMFIRGVLVVPQEGDMTISVDTDVKIFVFSDSDLILDTRGGQVVQKSSRILKVAKNERVPIFISIDNLRNGNYFKFTLQFRDQQYPLTLGTDQTYSVLNHLADSIETFESNERIEFARSLLHHSSPSKQRAKGTMQRNVSSNTSSNTGTNTPPKKKYVINWLWVFVYFFLIAGIIGGIVYFVFFRKRKGDKTKSGNKGESKGDSASGSESKTGSKRLKVEPLNTKKDEDLQVF